MRSKWWLIIICLSVLGLGGWWANGRLFNHRNPGDQARLYQVTRGNLLITVTEKGTLEPKEVTHFRGLDCAKDIQLGLLRRHSRSFDFRRLSIVQLTPKGTKVNTGDLLVEFDRTKADESIEEAKKKLQDNQDSYFMTLNDLKSKRLDLELTIEKNKLAHKKELAKLDKLYERIEKGEITADKLEFKQAQLNAREKKRNLITSQREYQIVTTLLKKYEKVVPVPEDAAVVTPVTKTAETEVNDIADAEWYSLPDELKGVPSNLITKYIRPVHNALRKIKENQEELELLLSIPQPLALYAPHPGYLLYGSPSGSRGWYVHASEIKVGAIVHAYQPLLYITNSVEMMVELKVDEMHINKVKKGQPVKVTPQAFPDVQIKGEIDRIAEVGSEGRYSCMVTLHDSDPRLKPKMTAKVEIMCEEIKDILLVSLECVFDKENGTVCYVREHGQPVERVVQPGQSNEDFIIIESGLNEGEEVYTYDPFLEK